MKDPDDFIDFYENTGPIGACFLGHYALNEVHLTQQSALARFKNAIEVASTFKLDKYSPKYGFKSHDAKLRLMTYLAFMKHLDSNLPDYYMGRCPLAGKCLPSGLEGIAEFLTNPPTENGTPIFTPTTGDQIAAAAYQQCAFQMRESRCDREEHLKHGKGGHPHFLLGILRNYDLEALSILGYEREQAIDSMCLPLVLIEHENSDYKYTIGRTRKPLVEVSPEMFSVFMLEASLQQMMCGEGPLCICYPHQPATCSYSPILQRIWDHTEPDPEWENNWKRPQKKPRCIE